MSKSNKTAFMIVIGVLTVITSIVGSAAIMLPYPNNGSAVYLTIVCSLALGMYISTLISSWNE
jgi:hypothetical protein